MHSTRRAYIDIAAPVLAAALGPLSDHGLEVITSASSDRYGVVRLMIAGDALPAECELAQLKDSCVAGDIRAVTVVLTEERYGAQRLVRVASIALIPRG